MSMTAAELRTLATLNLSPEQMAGVLELLAARIEKDDARRLAQAERKRLSRDRAVTVTGQSGDNEVKKEIPHTPLEKTNINIYTAREAEAVKPGVSRGTRLPEPFLPLPNVIELARNLGFNDSEIKFEIAQFTDHWRAASGQNAVKRDWQAALRNWFRNALKFRKKNGKDSTNTINGGFDVIDAAVADFREREAKFRNGDGKADIENIPRLLKISA